MVPATAETGCMQFAPGSHKLGLLKHTLVGKVVAEDGTEHAAAQTQGNQIYTTQIDPEEIEKYELDKHAVDIVTAPGDIVLFSNLLAHRAHPNTCVRGWKVTALGGSGPVAPRETVFTPRHLLSCCLVCSLFLPQKPRHGAMESRLEVPGRQQTHAAAAAGAHCSLFLRPRQGGADGKGVDSPIPELRYQGASKPTPLQGHVARSYFIFDKEAWTAFSLS